MLSNLTGTAASWTLVGIAITSFFTALGIWFKHGPDRLRAANEAIANAAQAAITAKAAETSEMEKVLANYGAQIKDFRDEVHKYRNEIQAVRGELWASDRVSQQRGERISTMEIIIELLIAELDPNSFAVKQAKIMLHRLSGGDPHKSEALNNAEHAVADAKQTVRSASAARDDVKDAEAKK